MRHCPPLFSCIRSYVGVAFLAGAPQSPTHSPVAMAFAAAISTVPRPPCLQYSTPVAMASPAAVSALPRTPRLHPSLVSSACPLQMRSLPFLHRRRRSLTTTYAALKGWTTAPVSAIRPANKDESIFLITVDLSHAPAHVSAYKTPGQYVLTGAHSAEGEKLKPAYFEISSAPRSGPRFDLLVKSVPETTAERLCKLKVGDVVDLGPCQGQGFSNPIENLNPPQAAETVLLFAVAEGISPIRALIEYGFAAKERVNVMLYYGAKNQEALPLQDELTKWEKTGVKVNLVISEPVQGPFLRDQDNIIVDPDSTGAILVGPKEMEEEVVGALTYHGVPHDKILTVRGWYPNY